jgi:hypothetical protein
MCRIGNIHIKRDRYFCNGHGNSYLELTVRIIDQTTKKNVVHKKGLNDTQYREYKYLTELMNEEYEHYLIQCAIYCN